jgi:hypothetical protein
MTLTIERAAITARPEDIARKLQHAPAWVRALAAKPSPPPATPKPAPAKAKPTTAVRSVPPVIGWVAGTCCPGVSRPLAHCRQDGEALPETFTPAALERMLASACNGDEVPVTFGHDGPVIATTRSLDVIFRVKQITGLEFEVRLRDNDIGRKVLAEIAGRSLGVSIGFTGTKSWTVDRDGVGRLRVVDECRLHHVAILPRSATAKPVYSGARCYGIKSNGVGCPEQLYRDARSWAFGFIKSQAGCRQ